MGCGCTSTEGGNSGGGGNGHDYVAFTYICSGAEGSDFTITIPVPDSPLLNTSYIPQVTCGGVSTILAFDCPFGDRTVNDFRVISTAAVTAGDRLDVVIHYTTSSPPT
jgi:hypothetical protein